MLNIFNYICEPAVSKIEFTFAIKKGNACFISYRFTVVKKKICSGIIFYIPNWNFPLCCYQNHNIQGYAHPLCTKYGINISGTPHNSVLNCMVPGSVKALYTQNWRHHLCSPNLYIWRPEDKDRSACSTRWPDWSQSSHLEEHPFQPIFPWRLSNRPYWGLGHPRSAARLGSWKSA